MTLTVTEFSILIITIFFALVAFQFFLFLRKLMQTLDNVNEAMDDLLPIIKTFSEISDKVNTGINGATKAIALIHNTGKRISKFSTILAYLIIKPMSIMMDILSSKNSKSEKKGKPASNSGKKSSAKK